MSIIHTVLEIASWILLGVGSLAVLTTGISMLRLKTLYTRLHGSSLGESLGAGSILLGLALQAGWSLTTLKLLLVLIFLVITGPPTAHALARAAQLHDVQPEHKPGETGR